MKNVTQCYGNVCEWLWAGKIKNEPKPVTLLRHLLQIIWAVVADIKDGQLSLRAMSLVYSTVISIVPLFAISFSVLKGLGAHNQIRPFLTNLLAPLGEKSEEITNKVIGFVDNIQVGVLGVLGIGILLYTVISMMQKIEHAFNYVWHVSKPRTFGQRFSDYLSVLLVGPLLIFLSAGLTTTARSGVFTDQIASLPGADSLFALIGFIIPYIILSLAFTFLYSFIPNTKVKLKAAFVGGLMTAFMWKIMGWGFSSFVANSANHTAIYSAFATIIVFMVFIYLVWLVLLVGSSLGFYWQFPEYRKVRHNTVSLSPSSKEALAVDIMTEIARRFNQHEKQSTIADIAEMTGEPSMVVTNITDYLVKAGLLEPLQNGDSWLPARPLEHMSVYDVVAAVRNHEGEMQPILSKKSSQKYKKDVDATIKKVFEKQTFDKLVS